MVFLPNEIYDDIVKFVKISSYMDLVFTSRRMRCILDPFMRRQKIRIVKIKRYTRIELDILETHFQIYQRPDINDCERIAQLTIMNKSTKQVQFWFKNRRAKERARQTLNLA
ncbi:homeobox domain-containing protein [Ditylenchus destructor]|nr:homeobox domain-containing protein [Ditylenchus destructor]